MEQKNEEKSRGERAYMAPWGGACALFLAAQAQVPDETWPAASAEDVRCCEAGLIAE